MVEGAVMPAREIKSIEEMRSLIGLEVALGEWFELTQERIELFAEATNDHQWIHIDRERARIESPYGGTIAHGFLLLSLLGDLLSQTVTLGFPISMVINYGLDRVRFPSAVPAGSRIRVRVILESLEEAAGGWQVGWHTILDREGGDKPCCVAEWLLRYYE